MIVQYWWEFWDPIQKHSNFNQHVHKRDGQVEGIEGCAERLSNRQIFLLIYRISSQKTLWIAIAISAIMCVNNARFKNIQRVVDINSEISSTEKFR